MSFTRLPFPDLLQALDRDVPGPDERAAYLLLAVLARRMPVRSSASTELS